MPEFNVEGFARNLDKTRKKSLLKRAGEFFAPSTSEGIVVAKITLERRSMPDTIIGFIELARFSRSKKSGTNISQSAGAINGFYGPIFAADGNSRVKVEVKYVFVRDQSSVISRTIGQAS